MKILKGLFVILLITVIISQIHIAVTRDNDPIIWNDSQESISDYGIYGECIDITPLISDIETVNGIDCMCIIYDGEIIYVPGK